MNTREELDGLSSNAAFGCAQVIANLKAGRGTQGMRPGQIRHQIATLKTAIVWHAMRIEIRARREAA